MDESSILVGQGSDTGFIRVLGKGSFKNARYAKTFADKVIEQGITRFVVDLKDCIHMDSTFMGMLAGLSMQIRKLKGPIPQIANATEKNLELLQNLGLDRVLQIESTPVDIDAEMLKRIVPDAKTESKDLVTQTMLDAHEALIKADERNKPKFEDVITYLRDKLGVKDL